MNYQLTVVNGPDLGLTIQISDDQLSVIGRGKESAMRLTDPSVSRVHFEVSVSDSGVFLQDRDSSGGTFVNGHKVDAIQLKSGCQIGAGETIMRFVSEEASNLSTVFSTPSPAGALSLSDLVGQTLSDYRLDEIIGAGASGIVFKATDIEKDRLVALKVLSPSFTSSDEQRQRFIRAMKTFRPVKNDRIVELYDAGKTGAYCWAAMEYIDGENLADLIERIGIDGMLDWTKVWHVAVDIARALNAAFEHKVIHRNVTPKNILRRTSDEACFLGDFMLAKALEGSLAIDVTQAGQLLGELPYLAPERTRTNIDIDTRSDIYGLGATCYSLLTGRAPAQGTGITDIVKNIRDTIPERPKTFQLSVNQDFEEVIMRMIEKDASRRYQTANELLKELLKIGQFNNLSVDG